MEEVLSLRGCSKSYCTHSVVFLWGQKVILGMSRSEEDLGRMPSFMARVVSRSKQWLAGGGVGGTFQTCEPEPGPPLITGKDVMRSLAAPIGMSSTVSTGRV